jgi:flagellar basal-body rod modification protein FlgD
MAITIGPRGPAQPTVPTPSTEGKGKSELGKDDFLKLLMAQLKHQDPLSPSNPEQFSAQLAQFSSLESMQNIEKVLQQQVEAGAYTTMAQKAALGASFVGKEVLVAGNQIASTGPGATHSVTVDIGTGGGKTEVKILDKNGKTVATKNVGWQDAGRQTFDIGELPAGEYTYEVTCTGAKDSDIPVQTYSRGVVDGLTFQNGAVILRSGKLTFPLDYVVEVEQAPTTDAGAAALAAITGARILPSSTEQSLP